MSGSAGSPSASGAAARSVSRRAALGLAGTVGLLGAGVLGGCDLGPGSSSSAAVTPPDPDQHVVDAARAELRGLLARLQATSGAASLVACHQTQLAALQGDPPPPTKRARGLTRAQLVARERRAAQRFGRWAGACQNGDLARVLASVAAGIRMQPILRGTA